MKYFIKSESWLRPFANALLSAMCLTWVYEVPVLPAHAEEQRVYQTDQYGNVQHHKPGFAIQSDGRIFETDSGGNKQYSGRSIQYHKPSLSIQADGKSLKKIAMEIFCMAKTITSNEMTRVTRRTTLETFKTKGLVSRWLHPSD